MTDYSELESGKTNPGTEAVKCAASLAVVDGVRGKPMNAMKLSKFAVYDYVYSRYIEQPDKKLFGWEFPKLGDVLEKGAATETKELTYTVNKWLYVSAMCWLGDKMGIAKKSAGFYYDTALAYGLRSAVGFATPTTKST